MITLHNVTKQYKGSSNEIALNEVSITFNNGLIHGIIGTSGAGKSTLIRLINKLEMYDKGQLSIFDYTNIKKLNKESTRMLRKRIGMIYQTDQLLSRKRVIDNILFPITFHRKINEEDLNYAYQLLNEVGLNGYENRYPSQLSGGQRQRVGIARALINKPDLLLCDEPTSALDKITTTQILKLIKRVSNNHNVDVLIVTHDMSVVKEICDTITVMNKGFIVEHGNLNEVLYNAKHPQTKLFIKDIGMDTELITSKYDKDNLLLLRFNEEIVERNIIIKIGKELDIDLSIIYANITPNKEGVMIVKLEKYREQLIKKLQEYEVKVENVI